MHARDMMLKALQENPIIASLKKPELVPMVIASNARIVMVSSGDIFNIVEICNVLRKTDKIVLVHIDLIAGMSRDKTAVRYLKEKAGIHGIVSSKSQLIPHVQKEGLVSAQRLFAIDTPSIISGLISLRNSRADFIEVMPGLAVSEVYETIRGSFQQPPEGRCNRS